MSGAAWRSRGQASAEFAMVTAVLVLALWWPVAQGRSVVDWLALALHLWLASLEGWLSVL